MKKLSVVMLTFLLVFIFAKPALANDIPGPNQFLAEILILPVMIILTLIGGGYVIINHLHGKKSKITNIVGAGIAIILSWDLYLSSIFTLIFAIIAIGRGFKLVIWGASARSGKEKPEYLANANPKRLIYSGIALIFITLFLLGMAVAFFAYWPRTKEEEIGLKEFVTYQLAYAQMQKSRTGKIQFHKIMIDDSAYIHMSSSIGKYYINRDNCRVEYGIDDKSFIVHLLPSKFPIFPFNYFTSQPSYYADETGQIRAIYVHQQNIMCPSDAPVVWKVPEEEINEYRKTHSWPKEPDKPNEQKENTPK